MSCTYHETQAHHVPFLLVKYVAGVLGLLLITQSPVAMPNVPIEVHLGVHFSTPRWDTLLDLIITDPFRGQSHYPFTV